MPRRAGLRRAWLSIVTTRAVTWELCAVIGNPPMSTSGAREWALGIGMELIFGCQSHRPYVAGLACHYRPWERPLNQQGAPGVVLPAYSGRWSALPPAAVRNSFPGCRSTSTTDAHPAQAEPPLGFGTGAFGNRSFTPGPIAPLPTLTLDEHPMPGRAKPPWYWSALAVQDFISSHGA